MSLIILAQITAAQGKEDLLREALHRLIAPTRLEEGCMQYDLHSDNNRPGSFVFYEIWETRELWLAHRKAPHMAEHARATQGAVDSVIITEMTKLR
ncbi:putative quinol monooxygenase [Albirhodobacter sp. R86504]|jgi:quinol monooxygenase YgiN|uniref:putative quinol monooxygenase n=1 Tax=Albirhodobacter sp. R86504 TaxID=3093848 RepID=UPI0036710310